MDLIETIQWPATSSGRRVNSSRTMPGADTIGSKYSKGFYDWKFEKAANSRASSWRTSVESFNFNGSSSFIEFLPENLKQRVRDNVQHPRRDKK